MKNIRENMQKNLPPLPHTHHIKSPIHAAMVEILMALVEDGENHGMSWQRSRDCKKALTALIRIM